MSLPGVVKKGGIYGALLRQCMPFQGIMWAVRFVRPVILTSMPTGKAASTIAALQKASPDNVLGDFNNTSFQYGRVASRFFLKNQQVMVETDGPGEQPEPYKVAYTIGDYPL
ncbi:hypothetical protein [Endozoicomonas sp.]|uniref:hypothetical protein n=1 Tax=Endozoicomonas sp. TaxID=1892382 RepID=UPI00383BDF1F